jgi:hexosaminidase
MLEANSEFPEQAIEYRPAGGEWKLYSGPVRIDGPVELRTRSAEGKRASRIVSITGGR